MEDELKKRKNLLYAVIGGVVLVLAFIAWRQRQSAGASGPDGFAQPVSLPSGGGDISTLEGAVTALQGSQSQLIQALSSNQQTVQDTLKAVQDSEAQDHSAIQGISATVTQSQQSITQLLQARDNPPAPGPAPAPASGPIGTGIVTTHSKPLNVRSGPGVGNTILKKVPKGSSWQVWATAKDSSGQTWYNLGADQWVSGQYFTMK